MIEVPEGIGQTKCKRYCDNQRNEGNMAGTDFGEGKCLSSLMYNEAGLNQSGNKNFSTFDSGPRGIGPTLGLPCYISRG